MATSTSSPAADIPRPRAWLGALVIYTCVTLMGLAIWGGPIISYGANSEAMEQPELLWLLRFFGGAVGLFGFALAQSPRWRMPGRIIVAIAGLTLLGSLAAYNWLTTDAYLTQALPGLILLGSAPFLKSLRPDQ
ncbi:MAG TPA: hypothetical protein VM939_13800 [Gemmatimonadaceae bacterium]|nr:hypothetical protein [Gemmatimonadaceae bacterium]